MAASPWAGEPMTTSAGRRGGLVEAGMLLMLAAMVIAPVVGAMGKWLSSDVSPGEIAWARFLFQTLFLLPALAVRWRGIGPHLGLQVLRGVLMAGATLCFFAAVRVMPLADAMAIFFIEPLVLTILSAVFLAETIGWRRLVAVMVGFAGALIVIQPSYRVFGIEAVLPVGSAVCLAAYLMLTRRLAVGGDAIMLQISAGVFGCLALTVALAAGDALEIGVLALVWPTAFEWAFMAAMGAVAVISHGLIVYAFRLTRASVLAPFQYIEIISATALGYYVFGDFPEPEMWIGVAIIVGSGLYVFYRERTLARGERSPA
jgi:S-adenosylmethionine uptake transporter